LFDAFLQELTTHVLAPYNHAPVDKIVPGSATKVLALGMPDAAALQMLEAALAPEGMLIVMERDPQIGDRARRRFRSSSLDRRASVVIGDPRRMLYKLAGPFDVIFVSGSERSLREHATALLSTHGVLIDGDTSHGV
jgi:predicted O-methyltransferase YrrM